MSFLRNLFRHKREETVALIDISANSVAGAYVRYVGSELPAILYTCHLPIEIKVGEEHSVAMLRALDVLGRVLTQEGIPALVRTTKSTTIDSILVSVDAPWQETRVAVVKVEQENDFIFTKRSAAAAIERVSPPAQGKVYSDASVIGTILNGYETRNPYGKRAHQAIVMVLTSIIDQNVYERILSTILCLFSTKNVRLIAGASLRYQAMRVAFPHENDAIILDATGPSPEAALVRKGLLVAVSGASKSHMKTSAVTTDDFKREFEDLGKIYPLPHTIFLLARSAEMVEMKKKLEGVNFSSLWLSDNPPKIIPIQTSHLLGLIRQMTTLVPDLSLLLMALHYQYLEQKV